MSKLTEGISEIMTNRTPEINVSENVANSSYIVFSTGYVMGNTITMKTPESCPANVVCSQSNIFKHICRKLSGRKQSSENKK